MNIYNAIKQTLTDLSSPAGVHVYEKSRDEAATNNYTGETVVIFNDYSGSVQKTASAQLIDTQKYVIDFKDFDEWDNADNNEIADESTADIVERMTILMNSVFWHWTRNTDHYFPLQGAVVWSYTTIWRANSNSMSGVRATLLLPSISPIQCSYA